MRPEQRLGEKLPRKDAARASGAAAGDRMPWRGPFHKATKGTSPSRVRQGRRRGRGAIAAVGLGIRRPGCAHLAAAPWADCTVASPLGTADADTSRSLSPPGPREPQPLVF